MTITQNYDRICATIKSSAIKADRNPNEITLITVSKGHEWSAVKQTYDAGCRNFGENRIQEALPKIEQAPKDIEWHFIGTLQKNKVGKVVEKFTLIHSVDTFELAKKISESSLERNLHTRILLQVNTSGEISKHGMSEKEWLPFFDNLLLLPNIQIQGLMTMAPLTDDEQVIRSCFRNLRLFRDQLAVLAGNAVKFNHLSMGMSHDYLIAIEEGATLLRIGSAIMKETTK